jgi:hypothetical protein
VRHLRIFGVCLVSIGAIAAITAGNVFAAAKPEFGKCVAKTGGNYTEANCQTKAAKGKGGFEWTKASKFSAEQRKFEGHNVGSGGVLTTEFKACVGGKDETTRVPKSKCEAEGGKVGSEPNQQVECESEANHGEIGPKSEIKDVQVTFKGCKLSGVVPCGNTSIEGEVQTNGLKGSLGYLNKANKEVGVLLEPIAKHGEFAKFNCSSEIGTVVGVGNSKEGAAYSPEKTGGNDGIISPIVPVDKMTVGLTQTYTLNEQLENQPTHFEGGHIEVLESYIYNAIEPEKTGLWQKAGEAITNENHQLNGEEVEIKA